MERQENPGKQEVNTRKAQTKRPWWQSGFFYILLLVVVISLMFVLVPRVQQGPEEVGLPMFISYAQEGYIDTIRQDGDTLIGIKDGKQAFTTAFQGSTLELSNYLKGAGVEVPIDVKPSGTNWGMIALQVILPIVLVGVIGGFIGYRLGRRRG
jgi:hypothetical protein